ncbi:MAG: radical SAM protein [Oscillospiraceae bacterium]|nr:radical SAM protein [Oscillospiraceae bacterium]
MVYILEDNIRVQKWQIGPARCVVEGKPKGFLLTPEEYALLQLCDGRTELQPCNALYLMEAMGAIRRCQKGETVLKPGQIREYPNKLVCTIDWTITERCNYNCLHCFHAADNERHREEFTREEAFRFLEEAQACGVPAIRLTGGEPTLYPYFREIVTEIRNCGMALKTLITNGAQLDEELVGFLKSLHPRAQIMLSFDGIGTHDWLRQHAGSEESVKQAIRVSKAAGFNVKINMNVNRKSRPVITDSVKMLTDMGVNEIRLIKTTEAPRWQLNAEENSLSPEEYYDFSLDFAVWYRGSGLTLPVTIWQSLYLRGKDKVYHILPIKSAACDYREDAYICIAMLKKLSVQANGDLIPCAPMAGFFTSRDIHVGNVKRESLQTLLSEGPLFKMVTQTAKDKRLANPKCATCKHFRNCQGGCPALSINYGDSLLSPDIYKCVFFEKGYDRKYREALEGWTGITES